MPAPNHRLRRVGAWLGATGDALVSVIFPADCRICEKLLTRASRIPICNECLDSFPLLNPPLCARCGQSLEIPSFATRRTNSATEAPAAEGLVCQVCRANTYRFDLARSYAVYQGALIPIVLLKFERMEPLGRMVRGTAGRDCHSRA